MKIYYRIMAEVFYFLGDLASKPLNMDWAQEDGPKAEYWGSKIYSVYNWLMLKSYDYDKIIGHKIWTEESNIDDEDENNL